MSDEALPCGCVPIVVEGVKHDLNTDGTWGCWHYKTCANCGCHHVPGTSCSGGLYPTRHSVDWEDRR